MTEECSPKDTPTPKSSISDWRLSQVFGGDKAPEEEIPEADIVNCIQFNETGEFLAAGDKGGRIVIFERSDPPAKAATSAAAAEESEKKKHRRSNPKAEFKFFAEFQSHELEFDYLKSMEIEEKINRIRFLPRSNDSLMLLTTNDKTLKLWKVFSKAQSQIFTSSPDGDSDDCSDDDETDSERREKKVNRVVLPEIEEGSETMTALSKTVFANAHAFHINSVSLCSDQETFLSADDLRVNLWSLDSSAECFNIVDIKPENMEELSEVITCAEFHPFDCAQFAYCTSKGLVRLCDLRAHALCDSVARTLSVPEDASSKSFFSEIISSISDMKFSNDGRFLLTRDYMTLKLWDLSMEREPVRTVKIHEPLRSRLCDLYENDCIFDKFECALSWDGSQMITGSYSRRFKVFDVNSQSEALLIASRVQPRHHHSRSRKNATGSPAQPEEDESADEVDFARKVMHLALHPTQNVLAATVQNNLFVFS